ncbi:hypothetical protein LOZ80_01435 [Paenibacillus sp. HWE-109]|uniref:hypothetical protein n=1 Tax=Paenibacillus sp. HWE-109 TaxID=1306526 RepID=UPI001EDED30D|nr:hypothetical protein [Paenibacillus sp. HWE-109]UKS27640.1 hypothetical protein LOZ80_01435 [Paenibacillus sp. HWE-109]
MSIFRIHANENHPVNSRYIQSIDLTIQNLGAEEFDVLIEGMNWNGNSHLFLYHVYSASQPNSVRTITDLFTNYEPFSLQLVTNIQSDQYTAITMQAKHNGSVIAIFTQEDFLRQS